MAAMYDPVTIVNFIFCVIIVILGYTGYKKTDSAFPLYIGVAFGLFGISHLAVILGYASSEAGLVLIRGFGYLIVIYALYLMAFKS